MRCTSGFPNIQSLKCLYFRIEKHDIVSQKEGFIYVPYGFVIWVCNLEIYINGSNIEDNNQECMIKVNKLGKWVSQYLAITILLAMDAFFTNLFSL